MNAAAEIQGEALYAERMSKAFGGLKVFHDVSFTLPPGGLLGVIGPNGAGKTTMINIISGRLAPSSGQVRLGDTRIDGRPVYDNAGRGLVRSFQQTATFSGYTVSDNLRSALRFARRDLSVLERLAPLLDQFGLVENWNRHAEVLPYGLQKMLGLTMALATQPRILLLDEPAAGLEKSERSNIDAYIGFAQREFGCGVLLVEHDMELIRRLCPDVIVLDGGRLIATGSPGEVLNRKDVIDAYLGGGEEDDDAEH
ncbi:branched-chain amino acid transport system ATP-binding protein/branched-chain amino acid transport system permease protein [Paracoccus thiocyanatus]|uniref:Branched-chain amino acid transport system ATP-binding protein/branched-chain amino acid transport system permease protein n=1 Tax=Paracoccus thiocyanatus TaxID=34006 RepID=A0A1N6PV99_9RHOB|nr:ATP-binding cassette domain-containing protein [Paracoccus thiocyanatus]SIQ08284.1 branched-chain amino acid transport system ATP-binding protein/branched-chain amino acid transport system permease protein [Paracoccus thiocyanatus]